MSIAVMKQALEVLSLELPIGSHLELKNSLRAAIEEAQPEQKPEPPPWWPAVENILNQYGLQAIDFVADFKEAIKQAEQKPVAWVYPEALEAFKSGKPWVAYGSNGDGPYPDGVKRIPLYLHNDAVARRVEPPAAESGAGFESLPASPHTTMKQEPIQESPLTHNHLWIGDLHGREKNT